MFQAENLAIRNESVAWRNMVEQTHGQSVDALKTQYVYAMEALKAQYTVDMDALKAQHAEELKKHSEDAVQKALGRTIKISEVALEMGHIVEPNSAEALQIGVKLKKLFKDQMGMEPGHVAREYRNGEMVACAYYVRDKELVRRAVESVMGPAIPNVRFVYSVN